MKFGNPERFAIELEFHSPLDGLWMDGRSCYWISGKRIGDFEIIDSLRDGFFCWEKMSYFRDRANKEISNLSTQELVATLYSGLYNTGFDSMDCDHQRGIEGQWARHNINPGTVGFKDWVVFLINIDSKARCLYARSEAPLSMAKEQLLDLGEFDGVLDAVVDYLAKESRRLGGS